ncbi:LysR family transcriptional regulator [Shimia abyssi]|uniref:DNA-binding transcriptional LysR family regulator n=1 Tax=Shimia abyssi TaxID=1662395 RepID=A0A2P8F6L0_9RHOB|nr:LysR family transcriptional regulator [Shimia abyssi]PSL17353.1 DNA-binding transcriptional LysR family regulator [Shimia abyssi]
MHSDNWDDMRFVLAVADTGTVSGAARRLGVNHATVLRRVAAFENRHGVDVFERTSKGYRVNAEYVHIIEAARDVGNAVKSVEHLMSGTQAPLVGTVRISSTDSFCQVVLPPIIGAFHNAVSGIKIAMISTNAYSNFSQSHADIAVRPAQGLSDDMVGDVAARLGFGVYAVDPAPETWLGLSGPLVRSNAANWMSENVPAERIVGAADSFMVLATLARLGMGRAVLPCSVGDAVPELCRLDSPGELISVPIWVACHVDLVGVSRVGAVRRFLVAGLEARAAQLAGYGAS